MRNIIILNVIFLFHLALKVVLALFFHLYKANLKDHQAEHKIMGKVKTKVTNILQNRESQTIVFFF